MLELETDSFESQARMFRRLAFEAEVYSALEKGVFSHVDPGHRIHILSADTLFVENFLKPERCLHWLTGPHREWLKKNLDVSVVSEHQVYHRLVFLPHMEYIANWHTRSSMTKAILLNLHLHLSHGVICGVVFINPHDREVQSVLRDLNLVFLPSLGICFDTPAFYLSQEPVTCLLQGVDASRRESQLWNVVNTGYGPLWIYYDEDTYGRKKLSGWRWRSLRDFFSKLYGPNPKCKGCDSVIDTLSLDHIAPYAMGYDQTILNFSPLCRRCNSAKGFSLGEDPFKIQLLLPSHYDSRYLNDIIRQRPRWIGRLGHPGNERIINKEIGRGK